jgi:hypothetical protein
MGRLALALVAVAALLAPAAAMAKPGPRFAHTVLLAPVKGKVTVHGKPLKNATLVKVGTSVDTTHGTVKLTSALPSGKTQFGTFNGSAFLVKQPKSGKGLTDLTLTGGGLSSCPAPGVRRAATVTAAAKHRRRLFGHAHGRFRTLGRNSTATVRGTTWVTEDRCDGTHTTDMTGQVDTATSDGLALKLKPGQVVTYYCSPRANPPQPGTYCVVLLAASAQGLIATGIIDITDQTQYDLCVTGPDTGQEQCVTPPFSDPMLHGFRESALSCYAHRGTGVYTVRWRVAGVFLFPPLSLNLTNNPQAPTTCLHSPKASTG